MAVTALANLDMLTAEEFYDIPPLEDTLAWDEKDREELLVSFDATSHQMVIWYKIWAWAAHT